VVSSYKALSGVERVFRGFNTDLNKIKPKDPALPSFTVITTPTAVQHRALTLLKVSPRLGLS